MTKTKNSFDPLSRLDKNLSFFMSPRHDREQYKYEKIIGLRTQTGALKLKRLTGRHRTIIGLHLKCLSNSDISLLTGYSEAWISTMLRDPLSQSYISSAIKGVEQELEALAPLAVDAVRQGLQSNSETTRLKASDRFFRATGRYNNDLADGKETAEDVIARALDAIQAQAGAINQLSRPERPRAIDVDFEKVSKDGNGKSDSGETVSRRPQLGVDNN